MSGFNKEPKLPVVEDFFVYRHEPGTHPVALRLAAGGGRVELMMAGEGWFTDGDLERRVGPGDMLWHGAGGRTIGRAGAEGYACLAVNLRLGRGALDVVGSEVVAWESVDSVLDFVRHVTALAEVSGMSREGLGAWLAGRLVCELIGSRARAERAGLEPRLREGQALLAAEWNRPLRMDVVADRLGWSRAQFYACFQAGVGVSPYRYVMRLRLREARRRLLETAVPIKQIAADCGFAHAAAFGAAFRAETGESPGRMRRRLHRGGMG